MSTLRNVGVELAKQGKYKEALLMFEKATRSGDLDALNDAGVTYERAGKYKRAYECYKECAKYKIHTAIRNIGNMYEEGLGFEKDYKKAFKYYQEAALLGNSNSYYKLSRFYEEGLGVKKDYRAAVRMAERGSLIELDTKNETANLITLGYYFENGIGVEEDHKKAFELFEKANDIGSPVAKYCLGKCYLKGIGIEKDIELAIDLLAESGMLGEAQSCVMLSEIYDSKEYGLKDEVLSKFWLCKGVELGSIEAQIKVIEKMFQKNEIQLATEMVCEVNKRRSEFRKYDEEYYEIVKKENINKIDWASIELEPYTYLRESTIIN